MQRRNWETSSRLQRPHGVMPARLFLWKRWRAFLNRIFSASHRSALITARELDRMTSQFRARRENRLCGSRNLVRGGQLPHRRYSRLSEASYGIDPYRYCFDSVVWGRRILGSPQRSLVKKRSFVASWRIETGLLPDRHSRAKSERDQNQEMASIKTHIPPAFPNDGTNMSTTLILHFPLI